MDHAVSPAGDPAGSRRNIVIVGGTGFWSEYHFVATAGHAVSYPGIVQDFQHTFLTLRDLPCDVFLGAHGQYFTMLAKLERYPKDGRACLSIRLVISDTLPLPSTPLSRHCGRNRRLLPLERELALTIRTLRESCRRDVR